MNDLKINSVDYRFNVGVYSDVIKANGGRFKGYRKQ